MRGRCNVSANAQLTIDAIKTQSSTATSAPKLRTSRGAAIRPSKHKLINREMTLGFLLYNIEKFKTSGRAIVERPFL
jgi:hypothetical protein